MEFGLYCDSCQQSFDTKDKIPIILQCGHTVCKQCAQIAQSKMTPQQLFFIGDSYCNICKSPQTINDFSQLKINQKLFSAVQQTTKNTIAQKHAMPIEELSANQINLNSGKPLYSFQAGYQFGSKGSIGGTQNILSSQQQQELVNQNPLEILHKRSQTFKQGQLQQATPSQPDSAKRSENQQNQQVVLPSPDIKMNKHAMSMTQAETQDANGENPGEFVVRAQTDKSNISSSFLIINNNEVTLNKTSENNKLQDTSSENSSSKKSFKSWSKNIVCKIHYDRSIEYFCKGCNVTVCSKCIFHHHNGHELCQLDDVIKSLVTKLTSLKGKVDEAVKDQEESKQAMQLNKIQIEEQREMQIRIINNRFQELQGKLEEKKQSLLNEALHKFDNALFKAQDRIKNTTVQSDEIIKLLQRSMEIFNQLKGKKRRVIENENKEEEKQEVDILQSAKTEAESADILALKPVEYTIKSALALIQSIQFDNPSIHIQQVPPSQENVRKVTKISLSEQQSVQNISFQYPKPPSSSHSHTSTIVPNPSQQQQLQVNKMQLNAINTNPDFKNQTSLSLSQGLQNVSPNIRSRSFNQDDPLQKNSKSFGNNTDSSGTGKQYSSKFAKLKFNRQGGESIGSQEELQLYVEPSNRKELTPTPTQQEDQNISQQSEQMSLLEKQSLKIKVQENAIFCIGDMRFALMFDYKNSQWNSIYFDKKTSDYQGSLKFSSICQINTKRREFILTGGCNKDSLEASSDCFRFGIQTIRTLKRAANLKHARYGHATVFINQLVLALGGFNHRDDEAQAPSTLKFCEKYSVKENEWSPMAPMIAERAYFSACRVKDEFVYVFGGFQNYDTTNSIEFYNIMLDKWTMLSISMPLKLAKYGLCKIDENQIVIAGGLLVENYSHSSSQKGNQNTSSSLSTSYSCVNTVYKFDCNTLKWVKLSKLNFRRTLYSTMPLKENGQIFAIGGTIDGVNEVYDSRKKKWNVCQSFTGGIQGMNQNDLQTFAIFALSKSSSSTSEVPDLHMNQGGILLGGQNNVNQSNQVNYGGSNFDSNF